MKRLIFILLMMAGVSGHSQDTLRVVTYNALLFPDASPERADSMRIVMQYIKPDILIINELQSEIGADLILDNALNQWGTTHYQRATYVDGFDMDNMLYYNSTRLGLVEQNSITTSLRDINEYILYYKSPGLDTESDTIYLNIYAAHLKAGSADFEERADQCTTLKFHMNGRGLVENAIVGGDFNFYSGHESGSLILRETGTTELNDPVDAIGNWSNDISYAIHHSQSSREGSFGGGVGGGLDDRFDMFFVGNDVLDNTNGLRYLPGSYEVVGQDGMRFNESVISPSPTSVPDSVANALYYTSDHLPVLMELVTDYTADLQVNLADCDLILSGSHEGIDFNCRVSGHFQLTDLSGKLYIDTELHDSNGYRTPPLQNGIYVWRLSNESSTKTGKVYLSNE